MEIDLLQPVGANVYDSLLSLVTGDLDKVIKYRIVPQQSDYRVDLSESEVVEFSRCHLVNTWIADGQLWFDEYSKHGKNSEAFVKWANSVLRWIRTHYYRDPTWEYMGPHAIELFRRGELKLEPSPEERAELAKQRSIYESITGEGERHNLGSLKN